MLTGLLASSRDRAARRADRLIVPPGARLAVEGRHSREVVVVVAGEVTVARGGAAVGTLGPGEVIGAREQAAGTAHDATYVARSGVEALVLTVPAFRWATQVLPLDDTLRRPVRASGRAGPMSPRWRRRAEIRTWPPETTTRAPAHRPGPRPTMPT